MRALRGLPASLGVAVWLAAACLGFSPAFGQQSEGITTPLVLAPFDATANACTPPPGLTKSLGFAKDNSRAFIEGVGRGLAAAATDRGLAYREEVANSDPAAQASQATERDPQHRSAALSFTAHAA